MVNHPNRSAAYLKARANGQTIYHGRPGPRFAWATLVHQDGAPAIPGGFGVGASTTGMFFRTEQQARDEVARWQGRPGVVWVDVAPAVEISKDEFLAATSR